MLKKLLESLDISTNVHLVLHKPYLDENGKEARPPSIDAIRKRGLIVEERMVHNDVVDAGEIWIAELIAQRYAIDDAVLGSPLDGSLQVCAIGDGLQDGTATATTQNTTDLESWVDTDSGGANFVIAFDQSQDNKFSVTVIFLTTEANGHTGGLVEAGLFAADPNITACATEDQKTNRMLNRTVFAPIDKNSSFQFTLEWTIEIGALTA